MNRGDSGTNLKSAPSGVYGRKIVAPSRAIDLCTVYAIGGDGHGASIGQEVVQQDLLRQQRQEGKEERRARHAHYVAEVRARGDDTHFSVLAKVRRPSRTPRARTPRSWSNSTMSAASLATSTALSTDIPTSAVWSALASSDHR